jgi:hypothetical protein
MGITTISVTQQRHSDIPPVSPNIFDRPCPVFHVALSMLFLSLGRLPLRRQITHHHGLGMEASDFNAIMISFSCPSHH